MPVAYACRAEDRRWVRVDPEHEGPQDGAPAQVSSVPRIGGRAPAHMRRGTSLSRAAGGTHWKESHGEG